MRIDETLIDKTTEIVGQHGRDMTPGEYNELKDALHAHIAARANQGRPFTNSSQPPNGILNKANLERLVHNDTRIGSKDDITNLIDSLAIDQKIRFVKEGNSLWIKPA